MSTATMHLGPEWMRPKHQPLSRSHPPSPPLAVNAQAPVMSSYSALVSSVPSVPPEERDDTHPFRYQKEELLRIYKEGGRGGLGLEVERWEGVVREVGIDPVGLREMGEAEKKLFAGPLNSDLRRRQSTDYLAPLSTSSLGNEKPRLVHNPASTTGSPMRERFSAMKRRDSAELSNHTIPRKQSLTSIQAPTMSPRDVGLPSPRTRIGYTPSFDGVLNNGESWIARRRASEASLKSGIGSGRDGDHQQDGKTSGIQEEKEEEDTGLSTAQGNSNRGGASSHDANNKLFTEIQQPYNSTGVSDNHQNPSNDNALGASNSHGGGIPGVGPPGLQDLASIEWSYQDPSGQVQGPFRADVMQKWYDDGYFTPDLPMKRTHLDTHWISVEELARRAGGEKIFLSPSIPVLPPGLSRRNGSPMQNFVSHADQNTYNTPFQPAPVRNLRSLTLDSYISAGSNHSDSPSSSFGVSQFINTTETPSIGGRANNNSYFSSEPPVHARFNGSPAIDPSLGMHSSSYGNLIQGRPAMDGYGYSGAYNSTQVPWNSNYGSGVMDILSSYASEPTIGALHSGTSLNARDMMPTDVTLHNGSFQTMGYGGLGQMTPTEDAQSSEYNNHYNAFGIVPSGNVLHDQSFRHSPGQEFAPPQQYQSPAIDNTYSHSSISKSVASSPHLVNHNPGSAHSPWRPFDVPHPTSSNTSTTSSNISQSVPWVLPSEPLQSTVIPVDDPSPWLAPSQSVDEEVLKSGPGQDISMPDNLTVSNVGEHNQQLQELPTTITAIVIETAPLGSELTDRLAQAQILPDTAPSPELVPAPPMTNAKSKSKVMTSGPISGPAAIPHVAKATLPAPIVEPSATASAVPQKAPWAKEDEAKKNKPSGLSVSLREIQENEAKKAEALKKAEREKERAVARALSSEPKEDMQPFTASWGLPTSQTGARSNIQPKEAPTSSTTPTVIPPVWTTPVKVPTAKKTMKEIQEEEKRKKLTIAREPVSSAVARRAYADLTTKPLAAATSIGGAWTTVGPTGKTSAAVAVVPQSRPPIITPPTSLSTIPRGNAAAIARTALILPAKQAAQPPRVEEVATTPSHEFLKWISDSLKGLNSSVNVEEIISMLLSFPMEPDSSTSEIISDLIYSNSTTLDGRRFAAEFVSKRKSDAAARAKGTVTSSKLPSKPISIADVVKATPKTSQPEWGFKVVNKKKKGGKA